MRVHVIQSVLRQTNRTRELGFINPIYIAYRSTVRYDLVTCQIPLYRPEWDVCVIKRKLSPSSSTHSCIVIHRNTACLAQMAMAAINITSRAMRGIECFFLL